MDLTGPTRLKRQTCRDTITEYDQPGRELQAIECIENISKTCYRGRSIQLSKLKF